LHLIEARGSEIGLTDVLNETAINNAELFRPYFDGPLITAAAYTPDTASKAIEKNHADGVAFRAPVYRKPGSRGADQVWRSSKRTRPFDVLWRRSPRLYFPMSGVIVQ
jgi:hypothetical protein